MLFGSLVEAHDVVIFGQRGTGSAEPTLACPNVGELDLELLDDALDADAEVDEYGEAYAECASDLRDDGVDPSAYNSVQNAHDVEALRQALGYDRWNVLGISYGTRLGQTLMRLHPEGVRAFILDSVLALERQPTFDIPTVAKRAFETLFAECAASAPCSSAYPDLETRLFDLVDQLDTNPVSFTVADVITGAQYPAALNGTGLMDAVFGALYSKSSIAGLPELVEQLESGETSGIETLLSQEVSSLAFFAEGMYWSVGCHEEVPFLTSDSDLAGQTGDARYDRMLPEDNETFIATLCAAFDPGVAAPIENELLVSDIPTLLLAGVYDPITPPADTESLLAGLSGGQYVEFPHTGHAAMTDECAQQIALEFLSDPAVVADAACLADIDPPDWAPDLFVDVAFEPFQYETALFSATGVAPTGWDSGGDGTFVEADSALHVSVILQQAVEGEIGDLLVQNVSSFLGFDPVELDVIEAGGSRWRHLEAPTPGSVIDMFVAERDGATLFVLLQHAPADRDAALDALRAPLLEAMGS